MPDIKEVINMMIADGKSDADIRAVIDRYNKSIAVKTETPVDTEVATEEPPVEETAEEVLPPVDNGDGSEQRPLKHKKKQYVKRADGWYFKPEFLGQREFKIEDDNLLGELNGKVDPNAVTSDIIKATTPTNPFDLTPAATVKQSTDNIYETKKEFEEVEKQEEIESSKKNELNTRLNNGMDVIDDPKNKENLQKSREEEIKSVVGYWEDGVFIPGTYTSEKDRLDDEIEQTLKLPNAGMADRGMYNPASNPLYFQRQERDNLEVNEEVSKQVKFNILDKALHQVSIYDFAEKNGIEPKDVDTTSDEFKTFKHKVEDLGSNEELYNRVVNEQYTHQASEVDKTEQKTEYVRGVLKKEYSKSEEEDGFWSTIYDTKTNEELEQFSKKKLDKYQPLLDKVVKSSSDIGKKIEALTASVKADAKWVTENDPTEALKKIQEGNYTTQAQVDKANADYARITGQYNDRLNRLKNNVGNVKALRTTLDDSFATASKIAAKVENIGIINDLSGDYYGTMYNASSRAVAATAEFITGTDEFTKRFNPMLLLDAKEVPEILRGTVEYLQQTSLLDMPSIMGYADFAKNGPNDSALRNGLDALSEHTRYKQTDFKNADWATSTFMSMAEMTPQILVGLTGMGTFATLGSMVVSSTGNNFIRFEEEGMTGGALYSRASFHGLMEGISETVTAKFGARTLKSLAVPSVATNTFKRYLANAIGLGKTVALEGGIEGLSEGFNSFATNAYDKYVVGEDVNLWEGVGEAFYQGASVSVGFKGPAIMKQVFTPFISAQNNASLGDISRQILETDAALLNPNLTEVAKKALVNKQARLIEQSEALYDQAITKSASFTVEERQELIDIEVSNHNLKRDAKAIQAEFESGGLTEKQKDLAIKELNNKYQEQIGKKNDIISRYDKITPQEAKQKWDNQVAYLKEQARLQEEAGGTKVNVKTVTTQQFEDLMVENDMGLISEAATEVQALEDIINDPNSTQAEIDDAKKLLDPDGIKSQQILGHLNMLSGQASNYGAMTPVMKDGKVVSYDLILNEETSISDGFLNTGAHEFVHAAFHQTLQKDPGAQEVFGNALTDILLNDKNVKITERGAETLNRRLDQYTREQGRGEEVMAITSELMLDGDVTMTEKGLDKVKGVFRRFTQNYLGGTKLDKKGRFDIKFDSPQDVKNFMIDYHKSVANNKPSPAIARMTAKGAKGKLVDKATAASDAVARKDQMQFSKAVSQNMKANPDLRSDIDGFVKNPDGTAKHADNASFQTSPDFTDAYAKIVDSKLLNGLVQQGMVAKGLDPAALKEFTRKAKEKIGERFMMNYNLDKNDSLFGWLTGVSGGMGKSIIYRAKGDVMAEYVKEGIADQVSLDKPVGEAGTLGDILKAEKSAEMEAFENQDLSPGRRDAYVNGPVPVLDQFGMTDTKNTVDNVIDKIQKNQKTKVDLEGLKYKGVKGLLTDAAKIDKNGKMKAPTKASDVKPTGALYPVLKAVAEEIGVDPKRIIANQDLNDTQRRAVQRFFYNKIVNADGSFNKTFLEEVLPEGETRSGEATGIANTKLGLLYDKGGRASFAEGATAAGKPTQTKRTDVTMEEMLGVFGINPDGTFQSGTASDGALRQGVLQIAQLAGNQGLRENALKNGTHSEAVIAQLADGKAEYAWSKKDSRQQPITQDIVSDGWGDLVNEVGATTLTKREILRAVVNTYGNTVNKATKTKIAESILNDVSDFIAVDKALKKGFEDLSGKNVTQFLLEKFAGKNINQGIKSSLGSLIKNADGKAINLGSLALNQFSVTKQRAHLVREVPSIIENANSVAKGVEMIYANLKPAYAGATQIGDKRLDTDKPGGTVIENKAWTKKKFNEDGSPVMNKKGTKQLTETNRQQSTTGTPDFIALVNQGLPEGYKILDKKQGKNRVLQNPDGTTTVLNTKLIAEDSQQFMKNKDFIAREQQAMDTRVVVETMLDSAWKRANDVNDIGFDMSDFGLLATSLGSSMDAPLRRGANAEYIQDNMADVIKRGLAAGKSLKDIVRYEHMKSKEAVISDIIKSYIETGSLNPSVWDGYQVQVISVAADNLMNDTDFKTKAPIDGETRLYNAQTLATYAANPSKYDLNDFAPIRSYDPSKKGTEAEVVGEVWLAAAKQIRDGVNVDGLNLQRLGRASNKANAYSWSKNPKGISVLDFDDTLATSKSKVTSTSPDGTVRQLTAEQFAKEGADLLDKGWAHDFSEFSKVVKGKTAPLFQKALKLQEKFGNDNMFILTARPADSAPAIFQFLKANGLNIPLKNITGLANSTAQAKADWIAGKVGEGFNDFYFADDAIQNVKAVKDILNQFDVKSKVQQAKLQFSKTIDQKFNDILEETTGVKSEKVFSSTQGKIRGQKTKYKGIIPASAQDFQGLLYNFLAKGKKGEQQMAFLKKALIDPFARGIDTLNGARQRSANDYKNLLKQFPDVKKQLKQKVEGLDYNYDQAIRTYLWMKGGFDIPGMSQRDMNALDSIVKNNPQLQAFAEQVGNISNRDSGYSEPGPHWLAENLTSDLLSDGAIGDARSEHLAEWQENVDQMFTPENLAKIEATYGSNFREALDDMLYRMKTGRNRPAGGGRLMNGYMNWINNSVGAIMFFNMRSAILQTISATNYINWSFNNPAKAAAAFANQPQFWRDFSMLFNSDYLKQRRAGNQRGINEAELSDAVAGSTNKAKAAIAWLLKKGFLPTQIADSFAIASGGASFYRNKVKALMKEGMSQVDAEKQAFLDFQETTEVSQQSARPDMISQQQASPLGRLILSFQNTPMQYARIINKAARDLANGRGDTKTHISKIAYYGVAQGILFGALQSALFAAVGEDEEEEYDKKKERIVNGMIDSLLSGIGYGGKAISTAKNTIREYIKQKDKKWNADHTYTILQLLGFSPPIGSKLRKIYGSIQTEQFNKGVIKKRGLTMDNPAWSMIGQTVEGITNVPLGRLAQKMLNISNAMDDNHKWWERAALLLGWNTWDLGIKDPDIEAVKSEIKEEKKVENKEKQKIKKEEKKKEQEEANKAVIEENKKKSKKDGICSAISKGGKRCKSKAVNGGFCTVHESAPQRADGKQVQCKKTKADGKRCGMKTTNKSGYCYYHD
tara:strand:+ start:10607 stop:19873 length:9267 start_codon:yes stop_codon:yes gene_type:complete